VKRGCSARGGGILSVREGPRAETDGYRNAGADVYVYFLVLGLHAVPPVLVHL
jgi:hypothetical protein